MCNFSLQIVSRCMAFRFIVCIWSTLYKHYIKGNNADAIAREEKHVGENDKP